MVTLSTEDQRVLNSLTWYLSARKTALRNAIALSGRTPLSTAEHMDLRIHYSGYFINLLSATELLSENKILDKNNYMEKLHSIFVFDEFPDGKLNYYYIRELRNAIIHRGLNIASAAHSVGGFLFLLAEPEVPDRWGKQVFYPFSRYLIEIINLCESTIAPLMLEYLNEAGVFEAIIDSSLVAAEDRESVEKSTAFPDQVKALILAAGFKPEWAESVHRSAMKELRQALEPCNSGSLDAPQDSSC